MNIRDLPQPHSNMKIPSPGRFHQACLKAKLLAIAGLMMAANTAIAAPATSVVNTTGLAVTDNSVKVGILHSSTGTMAISETGSIQAEKLAIEQINAAGGVLGRKIEYVQEDGASDWPTFAEKARKLLVSDKVAAIFGGWTSASRKAMLPVLEQYNGMLYYPMSPAACRGGVYTDAVSGFSQRAYPARRYTGKQGQWQQRSRCRRLKADKR
jgi:urea transport system substrate-binding protein